MKLPNGERAVIEDRKLLDYVLNPAHPVGRHHAVLFKRLLGIDGGHAHVLKAALLEAARTGEVDRRIDSAFGQKIEQRLEIAGPRGVRQVRAVWIMDTDADKPRLVTCFVEK